MSDVVSQIRKMNQIAFVALGSFFAQNPTSEQSPLPLNYDGKAEETIRAQVSVPGLKECELPPLHGLMTSKRSKGKRKKEAASHIGRSTEGAYGGGEGSLNFNASSVTNPHVTLGKSFPLSGPQFPCSKGRCLATSPRNPSLLQESSETHAQKALPRTPAISGLAGPKSSPLLSLPPWAHPCFPTWPGDVTFLHEKGFYKEQR